MSFQVPWGAVYQATTTGDKLSQTPLFGRNTTWKLFSVKVSLTRLWAASSAQFTLTRPILSDEDKRINVMKELVGVAPEDPIIIDLGYAEALFTDTRVKDVRRVFFGFVDTVNVKCTHKGVKVTVSCRDSMRFLIDNKFSGKIFEKDWKIDTNNLVDLARQNNLGGGAPLSLAELQKALEIKNINNPPGLNKHKIIGFLIYAGSSGGCLPSPLVKTYEFDKDYYTKSDSGVQIPLEAPALEESSRGIEPPSGVDHNIEGFNIMNRFPLEVIKHLASLEAQPRELFSEIGDDSAGYEKFSGGTISWKTRYTLNFTKPKVLSFLVPTTINGVVYEPNVISAETDWSTIGTISELIVVNPKAQDNSSSASAVPTAGVVSLSGRLPDERFFPELIGSAFPGIKHFTRRTRYIFDDTISAADMASAKAMVDAMFRIWGKDVRSGTAIIPGDATIRPGEAVQCFNFGVFDSPEEVLEDRNIFRVEAVMHQMIAQGPAKGFKTSIAFAEADENKQRTLKDLATEFGVKGGISDSNDLSPYIVDMTRKQEQLIDERNLQDTVNNE